MSLLFKDVSAFAADVVPPLHLSSVATSSPSLRCDTKAPAAFAFLPGASRAACEVCRRGLRSDPPVVPC